MKFLSRPQICSIVIQISKSIFVSRQQFFRGFAGICVLVFVGQGHATSNNAPATVKIVIKAPWNTPATDTIYACHPECQPLSLQNHLTYKGSIVIPDGQDHVDFTVNRGNETNAAADGRGQRLGAITLKIGQSEFVYSLVTWRDRAPLAVVGNVQKIPDFYSPQLGNTRGVSVWLPPGYDHTTEQYPVIYMHDGQNVFDPATSTANIDWQIDDILQKRILEKSMRPVIVVAIDTIPKDRYQEYDYTLRGDRYAQFLIETVKPYIDAHYRTLRARESTFTMGSSMGGIISLSLLWRHAETFSRGAGLSLAAHVNHSAIYKVVTAGSAPKLPVAFYVDHGQYNDDSAYSTNVGPFVKYLLTLVFNSSNFRYDVDPYGDHREIDWSRRVSQALDFLIGKL
jgi:predicted alpha/beta superfamily hydrolase